MESPPLQPWDRPISAHQVESEVTLGPAALQTSLPTSYLPTSTHELDSKTITNHGAFFMPFSSAPSKRPREPEFSEMVGPSAKRHAGYIEPSTMPQPLIAFEAPTYSATTYNGPQHPFLQPSHPALDLPKAESDSTGQLAPPGMKPRVTVTLWEEEGSLCFQVEVKGVCVARREDNHMINGTKLLNVAGLSRGQRDGILKSEKMRHIVKIGPTHLRGVWIPFERALDFANKEKITELLYPLFVHNIGALLYHPSTQNRTNVVIAAAERRKAQQSQQMREYPLTGFPSISTHPIPSQSRPMIGFPERPNNLPEIANTFPTPPTSASNILGTVVPVQEEYDDYYAISTAVIKSQPSVKILEDAQKFQDISFSRAEDLLILDSKDRGWSWHRITGNFMKRNLRTTNLQIRYYQLKHFSTHKTPGTSQAQQYSSPEENLDEITRAILCRLEQQSSSDDIYSMTFDLDIDLLEFLRTQYSAKIRTRLGSVITVTGTSTNSQAATCQDYLTRNWPVTGHHLLSVLESALNSDSLRAEVEFSTEHKLNRISTYLALGASSTNLEVHGPPEIIVEVAQQLGWLRCALQKSPSDQLQYSQAQLLWMGDHMRVLCSLQSIDWKEACWGPLFHKSTVVMGFPVPDRDEEIGLEIPVHMMSALAGVRNAVDFDGGIILKGHACALIPFKCRKSSIQWHFVESEVDGERLSYNDVVRYFPDRLMLNEVNFESITASRCFVGWWAYTETHLGTKDANYENISWSEAEKVGRSPTFRGATLGFQNMVTGELSFALGLNDGKHHQERKGPYKSIIRSAAQTRVVLYDVSEKRGWLVTAASVILHIARTRHFLEPYVVNEKPVEFPEADPADDSHASAEKVLLSNSHIQVSNEDTWCENYYLRDIVRDIWSLLESLLDKNTRQQNTSEVEIKVTTRTFLKGWEFMDLVENISPMQQRETQILKSSGGWPDLVYDVDAIVLFASGFEDIIKPKEDLTKGLCHQWSTVPKGKDYLTSSVPMLIDLYKRAGSALSKKYLSSSHLQWHRGSRLWEKCGERSSFHCRCSRLQQVARKSSFGVEPAKEPLEIHGAVIFGQASFEFKPSKILQPIVDGIYSQPNITLLSPDSICSSTSDSSSGDSRISAQSVTSNLTEISSKDESNEDEDIVSQVASGKDFTLKRLHSAVQSSQAVTSEGRHCRPKIYDKEYGPDMELAVSNEGEGDRCSWQHQIREKKSMSIRRQPKFDRQIPRGTS